MNSTGITIKEISSLSGFSVSTVSKALNNKQDISIETRKAIKDIAKRVNYVPNKFAVALRARKAQAAIAVVLPEVTQRTYNQALYYLQKTADDYGYKVLLYQTFKCLAKERGYIDGLNDGSTDGIIVVSESGTKMSNYNGNAIPLVHLSIKNECSPKEIEQYSNDSIVSLLKQRENLAS